MNNLFSLTNKSIVITGGTGVLGKAMVRHFASEGANVVVVGRNEERGRALVDSVTADGGSAVFLQGDVLKAEDVERIYAETLRRFSRIDVLINAAGGNMPGATIAPDQTIFDLDLAAMRQVVELNLFGTILPTQVFARAMAEQGKGSIINVASEAALRPLTRVAGYGAAKAAVVNFTKYLCGELAMKRALLTNPDGSLTPRAETILAHTPFHRFGEPEDLLGTLQWLASDASRFVSGTVTVVDGGFEAFSI